MRFVIALFLIIAFSASASFNVYEFDDSAHEIRFQHLIDELRCPKCQNNNLADSNAPLATDIKNYVYESIKSGKSDDDITEFLISRYGLFIIYDPKVIWIWLIPVIVVLIGLFLAIRRIKTVKPQVADDLPSMATLIAEYENNKREKS